VDQHRVAVNELFHGRDVVAPDGVDEVARGHEARPAPHAIASRQRELGVGELRLGRVDRFRVELPEIGDSL
jgi:hypothetical protein